MQVRDVLKKDGFIIIDNKVIIKKDIGFGIDYTDVFLSTCQAYQNALCELKTKETGDEA